MAEPLNATFFAFRKREQGDVLLGASIAFGVLILLLTLIFFTVVWGVIGQDFFTWSQQMAEMNAKGAASAGQLPPNFGRILLIIPIEFVWIFFLCIALAAYEASCLRWMIRGERSAPFNLCFGADMWRVYATYWSWFLYFIVTGIAFLIVSLIGGVFTAAIGRDNPMIAGLMMLVLCVAWVAVWTYTSVRLGPASATSIGVGHFAPLKAWSVSRERFWALFGSSLVVFVLYFIALFAVTALFFGAMYAGAFGHLDWSLLTSNPRGFNRQYEQANVELMHRMFGSPAMIALYIVGQVVAYAVALVFYVLFYGVSARAVQAALEEGKVAYEPAAG
jgi:hypothetical protein